MANLIFVGIGLGVFASMTGTIGKQLFRFSELQKQAGFAHSGKVSFIIGLVLNTVVGPIVDMLSYMFAPQSLIAPLGGLDVVWNTMIAPCTLGEKLTPIIIAGVALIAAGATCTSLFGNHDDKELNLETVEKIMVRKTVGFYLLVLTIWLGINVFVFQPRSAAPKGEPWKSGDPLRGLSLGLTAGSIAGNMFCVKAFIELVQCSVRDDDPEVWAHWLPYVLLVGAIFFAISNLVFLTKAMREYAAVFMGAVFEGSLIVCACISGIVVFSDLESLEWYQRIVYFLALSCVVLGIGLVAYGCFQNDAKKLLEDEEAMEAEEAAAEQDVQNLETSKTGAEAAPSPTNATSKSNRVRTDSNMSMSSKVSGGAEMMKKRSRSATCDATPFQGTLVVALDRLRGTESKIDSSPSQKASKSEKNASPPSRSEGDTDVIVAPSGSDAMPTIAEKGESRKALEVPLEEEPKKPAEETV